MRQADKKKEKDKIAIALMLCFCVIALTSIFTIRSNINKIQDSQSGLPVSEDTRTGEPDAAGEPAGEAADTGETGGTADVSAQIPTIDSLQEPSGSGQSPAAGYTYPVRAEGAFTSSPFAMDRLIYSVTLDQYMVHSGADIEAPADSQVVSMAAGTVTAVYHDDRFGNSVEITQDDGLTAVYSNLSDASMVETGDTVAAGQIIGGVGTTGLFESLQPAHLHLEVIKNGVYQDPMAFFS